MSKHFLNLILPGLAVLSLASAASAYEPSESDLRENYTYHLALAEKSLYEVSHILVADQKTANEVSSRIAADENWDTLVTTYSRDAGSKNKGGYLGWNFSNVFVEPFAKEVRNLKPGTVSRPIQSPFGWHLIKLSGKRPFVPPEFESVRAKQAELVTKQVEAVGAKAGDKAALNDEITRAPHSAPVLRRLIDLGADVNAVGSDGNTPLRRPGAVGLAKEVEILLKAGALPDTPGPKSLSPMHMAAFTDKTGVIVGMLLAKGAVAVGTDDDSGHAPIHVAAQADNSEAIRALIKRGEHVNRLSRGKMTPLMIAAEAQAPRSISALLDNGADPLIKLIDSRGPGTLEKKALDLSILSIPTGTINATESTSILRKASADAALKKSVAGVKAFITQDKLHAEIGKGPILLKKKPFSLSFEVAGANGVSVVAVNLGATSRNGDAVLDRLRWQLRDTMKASAEKEKGRDLALYSPDDPDPGYQHWSNAAERPDFHTFKQVGSGFTATREIDAIDEIPSWQMTLTGPRGIVTRKLDPGETLSPMLLVVYTSENLGLFEYAIRQQISSEVRWQDK